MAGNRMVSVKIGEVGFIMEFTLTDDNGDLLYLGPDGGVPWDITFCVTRPGGKTKLIEESAVPKQPYNDYLGICTYTLTANDVHATTGAIKRNGDYDLELTAIEPSGRVHKFPKLKNGNFGILRVLPTK